MKGKRSFTPWFRFGVRSVTALLLAQCFVSSGAQAASSCAKGSLCFWDIDDNWNLGKVSGNNKNWNAFGWNDRADKFENNGRTHAVCIYKDAGYVGQARAYIPRGSTYYDRSFEDVVSSNLWTQSSYCSY